MATSGFVSFFTHCWILGCFQFRGYKYICDENFCISLCVDICFFFFFSLLGKYLEVEWHVNVQFLKKYFCDFRFLLFSSVQFSRSVMSDSLRHHELQQPGLCVHHQLPESTQTHVHWIVMPFNHLILCHPLLLLPSIFTSIRVFSSESALHIRWPKYWSSASTSVLPMNTQDWSPLGWTGWLSLQSKGLSRVFSTPHFKSISSLELSFLQSPTLTSIHDHWKNHIPD